MIDTPVKHLLALYFGATWLLAFVILSITVNPWFLIGVAASMVFLGIRTEIITRDEWNGGINKNHNQPWEFREYADLSDGDTIYVFECAEQEISFSRTMMHRLMKEYKGTIEIQGL